jgi:surface antigen
MAKSVAAWNPLGKKIDLDNQSYDCVDVAKSWAEYLYDKSWKTSLSWGNAKDIWFNVSAAYWDKFPRGNEPKVGDIVCMSGAVGGGYGHIGVVIEVFGNNIKILQQNTFTQQAVYTGIFDKNASYIQGYLRAKVPFTIGNEAVLAGNQRVTHDVVNYRQAPNRSAALLITGTITDGKLKANETYDFKGFVKGEAVDGNEIWFVGQYSSGYAWSGGFTDIGTHDLADLTPAKTIAGNQRQIGSDAMNYRRAALVAPDNVIRVLSAGTMLTLKGYVEGMLVDDNNKWFVYEVDGTIGFIWSGGFADSGTHDLPNLTPVTPTPPVITPTPPVVVPPVVTPPVTGSYTFTKDLACVTEVIPAGEGSFEYGNFPALPEKIVLHDFGTEGRDTVGSTINTFKLKNNISAHFVVSGDRIVQMVSLKDRAYHAGPNGNNFVGIESDPAQDDKTVASVRLVLQGLAAYYGTVQPIVKHSSIMATKCGDDVDLADYVINDNSSDRLTVLEASNKKVVDFLSKTFKNF